MLTSTSTQDFQALKGIAGCQAYLTQENFDKLWCWLYPVAFSISNDWANATWKSTSPKWIEGFISKEEADSSLKGPRGLREPGTFVLRFPISRSWPHPDAGSLVVTYVGNDHTIHNRQISVDYIYRFVYHFFIVFFEYVFCICAKLLKKITMGICPYSIWKEGYQLLFFFGVRRVLFL